MAKQSTIVRESQKRAAEVMEEVKRQSRPRRWPWQEKTIRDMLDERRADLVDLAMERSAQLAKAAGEQREIAMAELQRQSRPRRWPWQAPTAYDKLATQRERALSVASERAAALTEAAQAQREQLLAEARRQSRPRRWPWQAPTAYDKLAAQRERALSVANERAAALTEAAQAQRERAAEQAQTLVATAHAQVGDLQDKIGAAIPSIQDRATKASRRAQKRARAAADAAQQQIAAVPAHLGSAADSLRETAGSVAASAKEAAMAPVGAVRHQVAAGQQALSSTVGAGRSRARRGVRVGRLLVWATLLGGIFALLLAPRSGSETRRNLVGLWENITRSLAPSAA